jgi:hypothetical protein
MIAAGVHAKALSTYMGHLRITTDSSGLDRAEQGSVAHG